MRAVSATAAVTPPPEGNVSNEAAPFASVVPVPSTDPSTSWKATVAPITGAPPLATVTSITPTAGAGVPVSVSTVSVVSALSVVSDPSLFLPLQAANMSRMARGVVFIRASALWHDSSSEGGPPEAAVQTRPEVDTSPP